MIPPEPGQPLQLEDGRVVHLVSRISWSPYSGVDGHLVLKPDKVPLFLGRNVTDACLMLGLPAPALGEPPPCRGLEDWPAVLAWARAPGLHVLPPKLHTEPIPWLPEGRMQIAGEAEACLFRSVRQDRERLLRLLRYSSSAVDLEGWLRERDWEREAELLPGLPARPPEVDAPRSWRLPSGGTLVLERLSQLPSGPEGDPLGRWERMVGRGRLRIPPAAREGTGAPWPRVTCLGTFRSAPRPDQHLVSEGRELAVLWFQDDWAPPVAREVLQAIVDLGWENVSEDLSSREYEW